MSYLWLDPETSTPVGYGSGGLNLQTLETYDDPERSVGSGNFVTGGMTGFQIHNNFLNLGTMCLDANNRIKTLELGQQAVVGDETYKGTVLYLGRKNGYGVFFAGGRAELIGTEDIADGGTLMTSGDLNTTLQFKIGVKSSSLYTFSIPNTGGGIDTRDELVTAVNQALLNNQLDGNPAYYGFESDPITFPVTIDNGDTLTITFDDDETRYSYTYEYTSPDGSTPLSLGSRSILRTFLQTALNQAVSNADAGIDAPAITKFISGSDLADVGSDQIKMTFVSKAVDGDGSSKGSLVAAIKGEISVAAKFGTDEQVYDKCYDFSSVLTADYVGSDPYYLRLTGENKESAKIILSNSGIADAIALYYIVGMIGSGATETLDHTKAPSISADSDTAFGTQLNYGGVLAVPRLKIGNSWAGHTSELQGALYLPTDRAAHDVTDEQVAVAFGGILLPGNLSIPHVTVAPSVAPSPEYCRTVYCSADQYIYIYDPVDHEWKKSANAFISA